MQGGNSKPRLNIERHLFPYYLIMPALLLYALFFILPIMSSFLLSCTDWNVYRKAINFNGLSNFLVIFKNDQFQKAIANTGKYAVVTTVFKLGLGLLLALALNRQLLTKSLIRTIFYMPAVISYVVLGLVFSSILKMDGLLNHFIHSIGFASVELDWLGNKFTALYCVMALDIWKWSGLCMAIFLAGLQSIPSDYYEASRIDGAGVGQQFRNITLPMLTPVLGINFILSFIGGITSFDSVYILTNNGPGFASIVMSTLVFTYYTKGYYGVASAMNLMLFIIVAFISIFIAAYFRRKEVEL
jgi:raffinose/stachyose/melibiose transport system permease protein